jgi:hypothetical protein
MRKIYFLLPILVLLFPFSLIAQQFKQFTDVKKYPDEVFKFFGSNITDESHDVVDELALKWDTLGFTNDQKTRIVEVSNLLLQKKARPEPHFSAYLSTILLFRNKSHDTESYENWEKGLIAYAQDPKVSLTLIQKFFSTTDSLLIGNVLSRNSVIRWYADNKNFKFQYDNKLVVKFDQLNLTCQSRTDSIQIIETKGLLDPFNLRWEGRGGRITWERAGYSNTDVFAELENYSIDLTKSEYKIDSVLFTNKLYFTQPLLGRLDEKLTLIKDPENATYPQFSSYTKRFKIKNIFDKIDYEGGFTMQGVKLIGSGSDEEYANLNIFRNDSLFIKASSKSFIFRKDMLISLSCAINIHLGKDSIYHPDLTLNYRSESKEFNLLRNENFSSQAPYTDSYHNMDMNFDQLIWKMGDTIMHFTYSRGASLGNANFESSNFFNHRKFESIQMMDDINPLSMIKKFTKFNYSNEFSSIALAAYMKKPISEVQEMLMRLSSMGFIFYDFNKDLAKVKPKLEEYLRASVGLIDYDIINLISATTAPNENATFNLKTYDINANGVKGIYLSDAQSVMLYPKNQKVTLKRNRSFKFDGKVNAGLLTFNGKNFFFDYNNFKINLQDIDSLDLKYISSIDELGRPVTTSVKNTIENLTGELLIDKQNNKSGVKKYAEYPIFNSRENSYVFYDKPGVMKGTYNRKNFYFELLPFTMDSLDDFKKESITFKGSLNSAGIFPTIAQQLSLQPDNSLGFSYKTDEKGIVAYGGKGTFYNGFTLSNNGLRGDGKITYLTSTTSAKDILFFPDSLLTNAQTFTIDKQTAGVQFPKVSSSDDHIKWVPYKDVFYATQRTSPFSMFNDQTVLKGKLTLEPTGLSGSGLMDLTAAELKSSHFTYKAEVIDANTSDFSLKSLHNSNFTVLTKNVNSHVDFEQKKGTFTSNSDYTLVSFPENKYISYLDYFVWDMDKKELAMGSSKKRANQSEVNDEEVGPRYISVHPLQDSLSFIAPQAIYDYEKNLLKASKVQYIRVADAFIFPDSGKVTIEENAKMRTLQNANITTNYETKYFNMHSAVVNISSRKKYEGRADYDYIDEAERKQLIHFNKIGVDTSLQSIGEANLLEMDSFKISPYFAYQGGVFLYANQKFLTFNGATRIIHECEKPLSAWLAFKSEIDPLNVYIPVAQSSVDINRNKIFNGMFIANDSMHVYPAFLSARKVYNDAQIVGAAGFLFYDKDSSKYRISTREKLDDFTLPDNYTSLDRNSCNVYGEGKLNLGVDFGRMKVTYYGSSNYDSQTDATNLDAVVAMDFSMNDKALAVMTNEIDSFPKLKGNDINRPIYKKGIASFVGPSLASALFEELALYGSNKQLPPELNHTIVFTDLKLKWNQESKTYRSYGKIGIGSILNKEVNKLVDGHIEISKKRTGDMFDVYLELGPGKYYYFGYTRGVMQVLSHNREFLSAIDALKPKERMLSVKGNLAPYIYLVSTNAKLSQFLHRVTDGDQEKKEEIDK